MRSGQKTRVVMCCFLLMLQASAAFAQDGGQTTIARALFEQGIELSDSEQWGEAADRFRRSMALRESTVVAFNLGTALIHTGNLIEATELMRGAANDSSAPAGLRAAAREQLEAVLPRLGQLTITVEGSTEGIVLLIGERTIPPAVIGVPAPADPGAQTLVATRDGAEVGRAGVNVPEGGEASVTLVIAPSASETAAALDPVDPVDETDPVDGGDQDGDDVILWVGVGVAALVVVAAALVLGIVIATDQGPGDPVPGNLMPGTIEFGL